MPWSCPWVSHYLHLTGVDSTQCFSILIFRVAQTVRNPRAMWKICKIGKIAWRRAWQPTPVFLSGESPRTEEPGRLQFVGLQRVRHNWATKHSTDLRKISLSNNSSLPYAVSLYQLYKGTLFRRTNEEEAFSASTHPLARELQWGAQLCAVDLLSTQYQLWVSCVLRATSYGLSYLRASTWHQGMRKVI